MADPRRWNASSRRDDQFVRPPAFRDEHESAHLSGGQASWHGSGSPQVALAAVLAIAAGIAAVAFMLLVAPSGAGPGGMSPVGAEADDDAVDADAGDALVDGPIDVGTIEVPATQSATSTSGQPLPPPGLPAP
jgi:hypothetical protein